VFNLVVELQMYVWMRGKGKGKGGEFV